MSEKLITIYKNPNGDTRTAPKDVSFEDFQQANDMHRRDVYKAMRILSNSLHDRGMDHDYTKKTKEDLFYKNFLSTINEGTNFVEDEWYKFHVETERHHLLSRCPEDVDLIDVIEMICDCVCAGLARSGEVRNLEISDDILKRAVQNTVDSLVKAIEVR